MTNYTKLYKDTSTAMQNYYRMIGGPCIVCGNRMTVMHHHVPWGRSKFLRFNEKNLIRLCQGCHMQHHNGDPKISHAYRQYMETKYGTNWEQELLEVANTLVKSNKDLAEKLVKLRLAYEDSDILPRLKAVGF